MRPRGRPPLELTGRNADGRSPEVSVSLAPSDMARVRAIATLHETSVASVIRRAVEAYLHPPPPPAWTPEQIADFRAQWQRHVDASAVYRPATSTSTARLSRRVVIKGV